MAEGGSSCLYNLPKSKTPFSQTVRFKDKDIYSKFESKIFQQYDEKNFTKKGKDGQNGNVYGFEYKSESVTISLHESTSTLRIQGEGCQQWLNGEFLKFENQLREEMKQPRYQDIQLQQQLGTPQPIHKQISGQRSPQPNIGQQPSPGFQKSYTMSQSPEHFQSPHSPTRITSGQQQPHHSQDPPISNVTPQLSTSMTSQPQENLPDLQVTTYKTPAVTGEKKKPLVSEKEFHKCFAIPYAYGTNGPDWSHQTILLYKVEYSSNATYKYREIPEDTWKRIDNKEGHHAELVMIEDLNKIEEYLTIQPDDSKGSYKAILSIEVILSYSPCYDCAQALCKEKDKLDEKLKQSKTGNKDLDIKFSALSLTQEVDKEEEDEKIKFKITLSNFYMHLEKYGEKNREGLKDLLRRDIKLDTFSDDNWHYFFNAAGLVTERQKRERDDKKILQYLEGVVTSERIPAIEQDLREKKLL